MAGLAIINAKVKAASSGDTVVLQGKPRPNGPPAERTLSLAFLSSPRLRREGGDEAYAFESREALRQMLVGKEMQFRVLYTIGQREYGQLRIPNGQDIGYMLVTKGYARIHDAAAQRQEVDESYLQSLRTAEEYAKKMQLGLWAPQASAPVVRYELAQPADEFFAEHRGTELDAIVEQVRAGDLVRVRVLLGNGTHQFINAMLAGVRTPAPRRRDGDEEVAAEPFGEEARYFVESRLLQRNVRIKLLGVNQKGTGFVAKVIHPAGNISQALLQTGFAKIVDWQSPLVGVADMGVLRAAEASARQQGLLLWKNAQKKTATSADKFEGVVSRIYSADSVEIAVDDKESRRIFLSSIRGPRSTYPNEAAWQAEAREYLRKKIIGKPAKVQLDFHRAESDGFDARDLCTLTVGAKNVAIDIVANGFATVIRHKKDDDDRSPEYDALMAAEQEAVQNKIGIHSGKQPSVPKIVDASESAVRSKQYLPSLKRLGRVSAVVEHIASASRYRLLIPRESARVTFVLAGVRAPRSSGKSGPGEPFGDEGLAYAVRRIMQRDIQVTIDNVDKSGGFIGTLHLKQENFAVSLVSEGYASVHEYSASFLPSFGELKAAEEEAKLNRKGVWHDYDPSAKVPEAAHDAAESQDEPVEMRSEYLDVAITEIGTAGELSLQVIGEHTKSLEALMKSLSLEMGKSAVPTLSTLPRTGDVLAAQFTEDNAWYRARVRRVDRAASTVEVQYFDYGNSESLPLTRLCALQEKFKALPPQAHQARLSFLVLPQSEFAQDARSFIAERAAGSLVANVDRRVNGVMSVTLYDPKKGLREQDSINADLVSDGLAYVLPRKSWTWEKAYEPKLSSMLARQAEAQSTHLGIWKYGDITQDDD